MCYGKTLHAIENACKIIIIRNCASQNTCHVHLLHNIFCLKLSNQEKMNQKKTHTNRKEQTNQSIAMKKTHKLKQGNDVCGIASHCKN